jgi:hypothetical protein
LINTPPPSAINPCSDPKSPIKVPKVGKVVLTSDTEEAERVAIEELIARRLTEQGVHLLGQNVQELLLRWADHVQPEVRAVHEPPAAFVNGG